MGVVYGISSMIGYFLVLLIFLILAVIFAKKKAGWILFWIGTVLQLISLIGRQMTFSRYGLGSAMMLYWVIFALLVLVAAAIIFSRSSKS